MIKNVFKVYFVIFKLFNILFKKMFIVNFLNTVLVCIKSQGYTFTW